MWSSDLYIGESRPWPDSVLVKRDRTDEKRTYLPEPIAKQGINLHHYVALSYACDYIAKQTERCPADLDYKGIDCEAVCEHDYSACWMQYFLDKAEEVD